MKGLGETSPFYWFTNPRRNKSVYFWSWGSYLRCILPGTVQYSTFSRPYVGHPHTCDTSLIIGELPEMSCKISFKTYHFLPKILSLPHISEEFSYIFYTFLKTSLKWKSPWCPFETYHIYAPTHRYRIPLFFFTWCSLSCCTESHIG